MDTIKKIFTSKLFYSVIGGIISAGIILALLLQFYIMPGFTNFNQGITVPDVTKISLEEAQGKLEQYGLRHEVLDRRANSVYPADYIIDQAPAALQIVKPNRKVYLTVNTEVRPTAIVPDVVSLTLRNAEIQIENYGFTVGTRSYESSRFRNTILRQSLAPGDTVARGTTINLVISDGLGDRVVTVPEIVGESLSEAQQKIRRAGLRVGEIRFQASRDVVPNTVLSFTPNENELTEGETLTLIVSERFDVQEESESGAVDADTTLPPPINNDDNNN